MNKDNDKPSQGIEPETSASFLPKPGRGKSAAVWLLYTTRDDAAKVFDDPDSDERTKYLQDYYGLAPADVEAVRSAINSQIGLSDNLAELRSKFGEIVSSFWGKDSPDQATILHLSEFS